jgi:hypothetical protein
MADQWPVLNANVSELGPAPTTLGWGTEGIHASYIVKSMRIQRMVEEIKIEQGSGLTSKTVLINDGDQVEITVVDDRSVANPPDVGDSMALFVPLDTNGTLTTRRNFRVIDPSYNLSPKQAGERVILAKAYVLIDPEP